ncbi:hypothetical protein OMAG_001464 [Candidatus Omnitrophus magneticus]|uniref:Uncharacterized protein n=1 Tax=Candidatus Omnitrophus magneticus TaxID=1609969 RepID=A0A0F0CN38_9BACT|nr:hypothetical protein OMAG_001464 [Candidatus Omnitrophus magneticus]
MDSTFNKHNKVITILTIKPNKSWRQNTPRNHRKMEVSLLKKRVSL